MSPNALPVDREYEGKKRKPEWGLNLSTKNILLLEDYVFHKMVVNPKIIKLKNV